MGNFLKFHVKNSKLAKNPCFHSASSVKKAESATKLLKVMKQKTLFFCFEQSTSKEVFEKTERYFKKRRDIIFIFFVFENNLSPFLKIPFFFLRNLLWRWLLKTRKRSFCLTFSSFVALSAFFTLDALWKYGFLDY